MKADEIDNPAWELLQRIPKGRLFSMLGMPWETERMFPHSDTVPDDFGDHPAMTSYDLRIPRDGIRHERMVFWRSWFTTVFSWAIPSPDALDCIVRTLDGRPLVEIGAGNGYWAWCLSQLGVDVIAYDQAPFGHPDSWYGGEMFRERQMSWVDQQRAWFEVKEGNTHALKDHPDRVLFMCWPPFGSPMAQSALEFYTGDTCLYIGEGPGGCNADDGFWEMVGVETWRDEDEDHENDHHRCQAATWKEVDHVPIPKFDGLHDDLYVFERITNAP